MKKVKLIIAVLASAALVAGLVFRPAAATVPGTNAWVSVDGSGNVSNSSTNQGSSISGDGRYVVYSSAGTNLVSGDTNGAWDIFLRDTVNNTTSRISVSSSGTQGNSDSFSPRISYDGRYVTYASVANNLVASDTNNRTDIFLYDTQAATTQLVNTSASGVQANFNSFTPDITADGRFIVFSSEATNLTSGTTSNYQIYLKDMASGSIRRLSSNGSGNGGNGVSSEPRISCDGGVVAFTSASTDLVSGDTNATSDIIVDTIGGGSGTNSFKNITISGNGGSNVPAISCDGNVIVFASTANNLVASDTNGTADAFTYNRLTTTITRVSVSTSGTQSNGSSGQGNPSGISGDGRYVVFKSDATNLVSNTNNTTGGTHNIYMRDTRLSTTQALSIDSSSVMWGNAAEPTISYDGTRAVYQGSWRYIGTITPNSGIVISETGN